MPDWQKWYEMLRDVIIEELEPRDGEEAEVALLCEAIESAGASLRRYRRLESPEIGSCAHQDAVMWNPYNHVVQCHRCGQQFVPAP